MTSSPNHSESVGLPNSVPENIGNNDKKFAVINDRSSKPGFDEHRTNGNLDSLKAKDFMDTSIRRSFAICLLYGTTSVSITFFNKAIFSFYQFQYPCIVTLVQILVCLFSLIVGGFFGLVNLPSLSLRIIGQVFPLSFVWWAYVVSGIAALRYLNIPMFSTLRKSTAMIVLILEGILLRKTAKLSIWLAIIVMVGGGFIAGATDLSYSFQGYLLVSICCVSTSLYLILIVRVTSTTKLGTFSLLFYNNLIAFPLMFAYLVFYTHELENVASFKYLYDIKFILFLLFSAAQATLLNIAIFLCTKLNSPLATTVTGQMKDFVTIGLCLFLFGDVKLSVPNLIGLGISLSGSLMYSVLKLFSARSNSSVSQT